MTQKTKKIAAAIAIVISVVLIFIMFGGGEIFEPQVTAVEDPAQAAYEAAQQLKEEALLQKQAAKAVPPSDSGNFSAMNFMPDEDMAEVAAPPKTFEQMIQEIEKEKRDEKRSFVTISDEDLDKEIAPVNYGQTSRPPVTQTLAPGEQRQRKIYAPVTYKLFIDNSNYILFQQSNKGTYPQVDFSKNNAIILISDSPQLPHRVFEMTDVSNKPELLTIYYRVNTQAAKDYAESNYYNVYIVPKTMADIELVKTAD